MSMPRAKIIEMANLTKMLEQELLATKRKLAKKQKEVESEELAEESNDNGYQQSDEKIQLDVVR